MIKIIADQHPCNECLVKTICGSNLCKEYSLYYQMWSKRVDDFLIKSIKEKRFNPPLTYNSYDDVYTSIMQHFINAPGMPPRIEMSVINRIDLDDEKEYLDCLLKKYFTIYIN